jgi:hypothetical protein|tara:strand:+ start:1528 stop:1902 length:375 start_codon:yes stop_codon:yes gene_type:complete
MNNYTVKTKDEIVQEVIEKIDQRSEFGMKKYGQSMMNEVRTGKKSLDDFIVDVQEELMDALLYLQSARHCLQSEIEEAMLRQVEPKESKERYIYGATMTRKIKRGPCAMYQFDEDDAHEKKKEK